VPTKRVHRAQASRPGISPATMAQLQLGHVPADTSGRKERFYWTKQHLESAWRECSEPILAAWTAARPGTRPWAWWQYAATEARRCLLGASLLEAGPPFYVEMVWRRDRGIPAARRIATIEDSRLVVESEAAYLRRLNLLTRDERRALKPAAFEPVELPLKARGETP
jgi:hypothetical protein